MKYYAVVIPVFIALMFLGYGILGNVGIELSFLGRAVLSMSGVIIGHLLTRKILGIS